MSTRSRTHDDDDVQNTSDRDPDRDPDALYHLLQEVSKLASHVLDGESSSTCPRDTSPPQEVAAVATNPQIFNDLDILNLIDLQCERLLQRGDAQNHTNSVQKSQPNYDKSSRIIHVSRNIDRDFLFASDGDKNKNIWWNFGRETTAALTLDLNANVTEIKEETSDAEITERRSELKSSNHDVDDAKPEPEPGLVKEEEPAPPPSPPPPPKRRRTPRKQAHPRRSGDLHDPDFQGVTFRMDAELDADRQHSRLLITSSYRNCSENLVKSTRKRRPRTRAYVRSSSSDDESNVSTEGKVCASCCTVKTPMWRDADDGTPLCNACGIRYKKYRVRCATCWHIPRKESNATSSCRKCGNFVRLKHT